MTGVGASGRLQRILLFSFALFFCVAPQVVHAAGKSCHHLFASRPDARRSDEFRFSLLARAIQLRSEIDRSYRTEVEKFKTEFNRRSQFTPEMIQKVMMTSKTLSKFYLPKAERFPTILPETMRSLLDTSADSRTLQLRLTRDPYFNWLRSESLPYEVRETISLNWRHETHHKQADPIELFLRFRETGIAPEMALILMQVNLDPLLYSAARSSAENAYTYYLQREVIDKQAMNPMTSVGNDQQATDAWQMVFSLEGGGKNLAYIYETELSEYQDVLPRHAFEQVLAIRRKNPPDSRLAALFDHARMKSGAVAVNNALLDELIQRHSDELSTIRNEVGLPPTVTPKLFYGLMRSLFSNKKDISYEAFLVAHYLAEKDPARAAQIQALERVVEVIRFVSDPDFRKTVASRAAVKLKKRNF